MSAFMVDNEHINVMVWAATHYSLGGINYRREDGQFYQVRPGQGQDKLGQMLVDANAASMRARYGEEWGHRYSYQRPRHNWSPIEVISAIQCFEYQACETSDWDGSPAMLYCHQLMSMLHHEIARGTATPWEISQESRPAA